MIYLLILIFALFCLSLLFTYVLIDKKFLNKEEVRKQNYFNLYSERCTDCEKCLGIDCQNRIVYCKDIRSDYGIEIPNICRSFKKID